MFAPMGLTCCPPHGLTTVILRFVSPMGHTLRPPHGGDSQQSVPYPTSTPWALALGEVSTPWALAVNVLIYMSSRVCLSSVGNVFRAPYWGDWNFSAMYLRHLVPKPSFDNNAEFYGDRPRVNVRGITKYSYFRPFEGYIWKWCNMWCSY